MGNSVSTNLFIINGTLCDESLWKPCIEEVNAHIKNIHYLFPATDDASSISEYATDIGTQIASYPSTEKWIIGYSLGGIIALACAKQYQEYMSGMILVCSNPDGQTAEKTEAVERQLQCLEQNGLAAVFDNILLPAYFGNKLAHYHTEAAFVKQTGMNLGETILRNQLKTLSTRIDQKPYLHSIALPTLLVYGEEDVLCTAQQNTTMHTLFPNSSIYECKHTAHMLPLVQPNILAEQIVAFIQKNRTSHEKLRCLSQ